MRECLKKGPVRVQFRLTPGKRANYRRGESPDCDNPQVAIGWMPEIARLYQDAAKMPIRRAGHIRHFLSPSIFSPDYSRSRSSGDALSHNNPKLKRRLHNHLSSLTLRP